MVRHANNKDAEWMAAGFRTGMGWAKPEGYFVSRLAEVASGEMVLLASTRRAKDPSISGTRSSDGSLTIPDHQAASSAGEHRGDKRQPLRCQWGVPERVAPQSPAESAACPLWHWPCRVDERGAGVNRADRARYECALKTWATPPPLNTVVLIGSIVSGSRKIRLAPAQDDRVDHEAALVDQAGSRPAIGRIVPRRE